MASTLMRPGLVDEAEALYLRALARAVTAGESRLCAMIQQNLGIMAMIRGEYERAERHYRVSLDGFRALGLHLYATHALNNLGLLHAELQQWKAAERAYADALVSCAAAGGDVPSRIMIEVNRAAFWVARRDFDRARASCDTAGALAAEVGDERALAEIGKQRGVIARELGDFAGAEDQLVAARALAEGREDLLLAAQIAREQAELAWLQHRSRETLQHLNRAHRLFSQLRAERSLADVGGRMERLEATFLDIVRGWSQSIESADHYTRGHCDRVAEYACALAAESGFDQKTLFWFRMGALLHDVGKIVVPEAILNKPGALTPEERAVMQSHAQAGAEMLADVDVPWDILPMVRHHHEQWNGNGYPHGLAGEAIPLSARILCVADVYDALTSERPYRAAYDHARAMSVMHSMAGAFDPELLARFVEIAGRNPHWPIASTPPAAPTAFVGAALARSA
jgi:putative nucleotidyltransferase with HDIG domain